MQQITVYQNGKLSVDVPAKKLEVILQDKQAVVWLDLNIDTDFDTYTQLLKNTFKLAPITIASIEEIKERAKLVESHNYFYLVLHALTFDKATIDGTTPKLDIVFGYNFIITIHRSPMPWLTEILKATHHNSEDNFIGRGIPFLLHNILDTLVDSYFPVLDEIDDLIDELENEVVEKANNEVQSRIFDAKRTISTMRRVISPQIEVSNALVIRTKDFIPTEVEPYFSDVHDHLVRTFEVLDSYRDLLSGLLDVYLSTISNNLNVVMKQLAIISTIFLPITFITGIFGQNFAHSPQVEHDNGLNFWLILAFMALVTLGQIWYFHHRKWL